MRRLRLRQGAAPVVATLAGFTLLAAPAHVAAAPTPSIDSARIDAAFAPPAGVVAPGCAAGIVHEGRLAWSKGYGYASVEHEVRIDPGTVFDLGSTSKQITAALIALLAHQGKLGLDDPVGRFMPEMPGHTRRVTIRQLLTHTSGLRDYTDLLSFAGRRTADVTTEAEALAAIARQRGVNFDPGSAWRYCNTGYFLLAVIAGRVGGAPLRAQAGKAIFGPLGMERTTFFDDHTLVVPHRATGYSRPHGSPPAVDMSNWEQVGDGGVQSSIEDMARWAALFDDAGAKASLPAAWLRETLETPGRLNDGTTLGYGLGLGLDSHRGLRLVEHGGAWAGYRAMLMRLPECRIATIVLCNYAQADTRSLAAALADAAIEAFPSAASRRATPRVESAPRERKPAPASAAGERETFYNLALGEVVTLERAGDDLAIDEGRASIPLFPDGRLAWKTADGRIAITLAEDRQSLTWSDAGESDPRPVTYRRAHAPRPTSVDRHREMEGAYQSDEIGPAWKVTVRGKDLHVAIEGGEGFDLEPLDADLFTGDYGLVAVERGADRRPVALSVTNRGVAGLRIPRVAAGGPAGSAAR